MLFRSTLDAMKAMVEKYTTNIPSPVAASASFRSCAPVVLLTGSTGNIGTHILASLLADARIGKVYTLNRPSSTDAHVRLKAAFADRRLPVESLYDSRCVSLVGDIGQDQFGLEPSVYSEV